MQSATLELPVVGFNESVASNRAVSQSKLPRLETTMAFSQVIVGLFLIPCHAANGTTYSWAGENVFRNRLAKIPPYILYLHCISAPTSKNPTLLGT